jgi:hypothetical protein
MEQTAGFPCDLQVLTGRDHNRSNARGSAADVLIKPPSFVRGLLDVDAEEGKRFGGKAAYRCRALTDPAGECEHIEPTRSGGHGTDAGHEPMHEHLERQPRPRYHRQLRAPRPRAYRQFLRARAYRAMFKCGGNLMWSEVLVLLEPQDKPRIHGSRASGHDQPFSVEAAIVDQQPVVGLVAQSHDQRLLVVGSNGGNVVTATLLGSVCRGVLHHATCPVAVIPLKR